MARSRKATQKPASGKRRIEQYDHKGQQRKNNPDASVARSGETLRQAEWRAELLKTGIRGKNNQMILFSRVEPLAGTRWLHADAESLPNDRGSNSMRERKAGAERVVVSFGPEHAPFEQRQVELAWEEARTLSPRPGILIFAAFQFDPEAAKDIDELTREKTGMTFLKVQMNPELLTEDLKKKRASNEPFWLMGQPDVEVRAIAKGEHNAIELAGLQGASVGTVRAFLDSLGPYRVPVELNPWTVVKREGEGLYAQAAVSESFMEAYSRERFASCQSTDVIDTSSEHCFRLGPVLDWVQKDADSVGARTGDIHGALQGTLEEWRAQYDTDQHSLDCLLPTFEERRPATFVHSQLLHLLVRELKGYHLTRNDSFDFCHAVMAAAYGGLATLDKAWKRRIDSLPTPNRLAKVYYGPELDKLVSDLQWVETS